MMRNWRLLLGRAVCGLGLLLATQLAYAAGECVSALQMESVVPEQRCLNSAAAPDSCMANPQRIDAVAVAPAPASPDFPPSTDVPAFARRVLLADIQPQPPGAFAAGVPTPLYILFRRYLS